MSVLVADCQSSGATPAYGDVLSLGWGVTTGANEVTPGEAVWVTRATARPVPRPIRALTGWSESVAAASIDRVEAWSRLLHAADVARPAGAAALIPTVIHFSRFELPFFRDLHELHAAEKGVAEPFPLEIVCLHAIACRLFPTLPRRNLRALAGHLGGSPEMVRSSKGHVEATSLVWRAMVPRLAEAGVHTWSELREWLLAKSTSTRPPASSREFPIASEKRRALPDKPGVYRFLRPNGDVLYVGKATSLKKRVASHFRIGARATERSLEMLSQAHDIDATPTATALEAALLEADEIKRLDPPYNVHLRSVDREAWFLAQDWSDASPAADATHRVGPLPSRFAARGIAAICALLRGEEATPNLRAAAVSVPTAFAPDAPLFEEVWRAFASSELGGERSPRRRILEASARIVVSERPEEAEGADVAEAPAGWDASAIRRYLERVIVGQGTLVRRARALALLCDAHVTFREQGDPHAHLLVLAGGQITARRELCGATHDDVVPRPPPLRTRLGAFDASVYDRLRVLLTELRRVAQQGGLVDVRVGRHRLMTVGTTSHE